MALNANRWGDAIAAAVAAVPIPQDEFITEAELQNIWRIICAEHITELSANAEVAPGAFIDSMAGAVTGIGGPIS